MKNEEIIRSKINDALTKLNVSTSECNYDILKTSSPEHGDLASNVALKLAKILKRNPMDIANDIVSNTDLSNLRKIEIAKPGFLNFFFEEDNFSNVVKHILTRQEQYGNFPKKNRKICLEFASINPTGDIHLGHARGAAIGDSLARILTAAGYDVKKEYYVNDGGAQVKHLGESLRTRYFALFGKNLPMPEDGYFGQDVIDIANLLKEEVGDAYLKEDEETLNIFIKRGIELELDKIKHDLKMFRVEFDIFTSEKAIRDSGLVEEVIKKLEPYSYKDDNALLLKTSLVYDEKDRVIIKSNGEYTYLLPDIAYHVNKFERGFDYLIDLFGADHHGYIHRMKSALHLLGYDESRLTIDLIQMVRILKDGKEVKLSKREGVANTLRSLIEEVGVDACRYFFVSRSQSSHLDLDLSVMTAQNNTNPLYYASYAHARLCSVLKQTEDLTYDINSLYYKEEAELELIKKLNEFEDVIADAATSLSANKICLYAQKLAQLIHVFYTECRIINKDDIDVTKNRLALADAARITMKRALTLIGVDAPTQM